MVTVTGVLSGAVNVTVSALVPSEALAVHPPGVLSTTIRLVLETRVPVYLPSRQTALPSALMVTSSRSASVYLPSPFVSPVLPVGFVSWTGVNV